MEGEEAWGLFVRVLLGRANFVRQRVGEKKRSRGVGRHMLFMSYHTHTFYDLEGRERWGKKGNEGTGTPKKGSTGGG